MGTQRGELLRGAGALYLLQLASRLSGLLLSMLLTRLIPLEEYGAYVLVFSALTLFLVAGDLGIGDAVLALVPQLEQRGQDDEASNLVASAFALRTLLGISIGVALFVCAEPLALRFYPSVPALGGLLRIVSVVPAFEASASLVNTYLILKRQYHLVFRVGALATSAKMLLVPVTVYLAPSAWGATMATAASMLVGSLFLLAICVVKLRRVFFRMYVSPHAASDLARCARRLVGFGGFLTLNSLAAIAREQGKSLLAGAMLGPAAAGLFSRASILADIPIDAATAIRGVVVPFLSERSRDGADELRRRYLQVARLVILYACVVTIVMMLFSEEIVVLLFSAKFVAASPILAVLVAITMLRVVGIPIVGLLTALGESRTLAQVGLGFTLVFLPSMYLVIPSLGLIGLAAGVVVSYVVLVPTFAAIAARKSGVAFEYSLLLRPTAAVITAIMVWFLLAALGAGPLLAKPVAMLVFGAIFVGLCLTPEDLALAREVIDRAIGHTTPTETPRTGMRRVRLSGNAGHGHDDA